MITINLSVADSIICEGLASFHYTMRYSMFLKHATYHARKLSCASAHLVQQLNSRLPARSVCAKCMRMSEIELKAVSQPAGSQAARVVGWMHAGRLVPAG